MKITYSSHDHRKLCLLAMHTNVSLIVGHPNGCMFFNWLLPTYIKRETFQLKIKFHWTPNRSVHILFRSKSSMHLFMCAIHSCFSVLVAAYTANDFVVVRMSHPFRYSWGKKSNYIFKLGAQSVPNEHNTYVHYLQDLAIGPLRVVSDVVCCTSSYW